jgi:hypothetical protein
MYDSHLNIPPAVGFIAGGALSGAGWRSVAAAAKDEAFGQTLPGARHIWRPLLL